MAHFPSNANIHSAAYLPADLYVEGIHLGKVERPVFSYHREMAPIYTMGNLPPVRHHTRTITIRLQFLGDVKDIIGYEVLFSSQPIDLIFDCPINDAMLRTYKCRQALFDKVKDDVYYFEATHLQMEDIPRKNKGALRLLKR
jgi:hypothetical protein